MNKIVQFKTNQDKVYPKIKREIATARLNARYLQNQIVAWQSVKVNLNECISTSNKLNFNKNGIKIGKGVKKILASGQIAYWRGNANAVTYFQTNLCKNGTVVAFDTNLRGEAHQISCVITPILLTVEENDLIQLFSQFGNYAQGFNILENGTFLTVEVVE